MKVSRFEELECWQEARALSNDVYSAIKQSSAWKKDLRLCGQLQAAAGSVMANIAEGFARRSDKEFVQFLFIALASASELQSHLYIARDQGYLAQQSFDSIYNRAHKTSKIISGHIKYLRTRSSRQIRQTKQIEL